MVDGALVGVDQRRQLGEQHLADGVQLALALQHAGEFGEVGLQPVLLAVAFGGFAQVGDHRVDVVLQLGHLAARLDLDGAREIALGHGGGDLGDGAHLGGEVGGEQIDVAGEILPGAGGAGDVGLAAEPPVDADFARDVGHLVGEGGERVGHVVDGVGERGDLALGLHGEALAQVAVGHGGHDLHDAADLLGEVGGHEVDVVGEILPGAADAGDLRLAAELALGADFAGHAGDLAGEGVELIDHRVDGVLQLEDFALHVDGDLAVEVAARDGGGDFGDVADLGGEVRAHRVDGVGEILPGAGHAGHHGLHAEPALGADLARHARHFRGERAELLDHRVDGFLELQDLAAHVDGDLLGQVAVGHGDGHLGDVADLAGEVRGHRVDVVGEILPGAGHAGHLRLAAELALGADLAGHARHFRGERRELLDHRVDGFLELQDLALHVDGDLAAEIAARDGGGHVGDVADLAGEVGGHGVDVVGEVLPGAGDAGHLRLAAELAVGADLAGHAADFRGEGAELIDHRVDGFLELQNLAAHVDGDLLGQVAVGDGDRHLGDVADLAGEVVGHRVDVVGEILPGAGHAGHRGLAAELAFGADFARHAADLAGEGVELIDHRVDGVLQLQESRPSPRR